MTDVGVIRTRLSRARVAARILLAPYLVALALIVFLPAREAGRVTGIVGWAADLVAAWGVPREPAAVVFEFLANVALFVPFGLLLSAAAPRWSPWAIIGVGCLVSLGIELVQLGIPSRVATISDVIANTVGVAIGCALVAVAGASSIPGRGFLVNAVVSVRTVRTPEFVKAGEAGGC